MVGHVDELWPDGWTDQDTT